MRPNSRYDRSNRPTTANPGPLAIAIIQPQTIRLRTNRQGQTYATVRADVAFQNRNFERTVMIYAQNYPQFAPVLTPRRPLQVKLSRAIRFTEDGAPGGEFMIARAVVDTLEPTAPRADSEPTGRAVAAHDRKGHYRRQRHGKGGQLVKIVWVGACRVADPDVLPKRARKAEHRTTTKTASTRHNRRYTPARSGAEPSRWNAPQGWTGTHNEARP